MSSNIAQSRYLANTYRRLPNANDLVLTLDGKPIPGNLFEYWFRKAHKDTGIEDFRFHDLRHCVISRWAAAGIPIAAAMQAAGHKTVASHKKYQNLRRHELKAAFQKLFPSCSRKNPQEREEERESAASA